MTNDLVARFGYMPYEGEHETVIPHVTVATVDDEAVLAEIAAFVEPSLPIACAGGTVQLLQRGGDLHWHERESWSL